MSAHFLVIKKGLLSHRHIMATYIMLRVDFQNLSELIQKIIEKKFSIKESMEIIPVK